MIPRDHRDQLTARSLDFILAAGPAVSRRYGDSPLPIRIRRLLYAAALLAPVVVAGLNAPPFIETTKAQVVITNHYFGPNSPAVFDANGNGIPGSGDLPATPTRSGSLVTLISPLDCNTGDGDNQGALGGSLNGRLSTLSRSSDGGRTQDLQVT